MGINNYEYSPFSEIVVQSGDLADSLTHRFSTKPWPPVTGLSEYELRKYSPLLGRWMNRDPMEERGSILLSLEPVDSSAITRNYTLEDQWPKQSRDSAISAIAGQIWHYYDDFPEKPLTSRVLKDEVVQLIERCICFLVTNLEYMWPYYSFETKNITFLQRLLDFSGTQAHTEWDRFCAAGDIDVWPFICRDEYIASKPVLKES